MILYEKENAYILIAQHEHARISGDLMSAWTAWQDQAGNVDPRLGDIIFAAYEHDRSWLDLDSWPLWNDKASAPYSFIDFPPKVRFLYYNKGLDEVQSTNGYAALLCSMLYTSLVEKFQDEDAVQFVNREYDRQNRIKQLFKVDEHQLRKHISALLLCDGLSLFACMREPGTPRSEISWFANGFRYEPQGNKGEEQQLFADWRGHTEIALDPFPFVQTVDTVITYKEVSKDNAAALGLEAAYRKAELREHAIRFVSA
ncbi:DUF3891 family protein [Paenibacillus gorillae]|uniref:DUF3891 family protein n=1 Tax=Paenibacillus gorillae TaxID=1243662 RepID=UPI0005AAADDD|nr:DUF3891 family protein [Paenibacillus gorillae]